MENQQKKPVEELCYRIDEANSFVFLEWRRDGKVTRQAAMGLTFDSALDRKFSSSPAERKPLWEAARAELLARKLIKEA